MDRLTLTDDQAATALRHLAEHDPTTFRALTGTMPPPAGAAASFDWQSLLRQVPTFLARAQALYSALIAAGVIPAGALSTTAGVQ